MNTGTRSTCPTSTISAAQHTNVPNTPAKALNTNPRTTTLDDTPLCSDTALLLPVSREGSDGPRLPAWAVTP